MILTTHFIKAAEQVKERDLNSENPTEQSRFWQLKHQSTHLRKEISNAGRKQPRYEILGTRASLLAKVSLSAVTAEWNRMVSQVSPRSGHSHLSPFWIL